MRIEDYKSDAQLFTHFAPPERLGEERLREQVARIERNHLVEALLDLGPAKVLILNSHRQVLAGSTALLKSLGGDCVDRLLGQRPGEALNCLHSRDCPGGCGTSEYCRECGAAQAILSAVNGVAAEKECHLSLKRGDDFQAMDLLVSTKPLRMNGEDFVIVMITDLGDRKRKEALEKTFFHDVMNLAGGVKGVLELLRLNLAADQLPILELANNSVHDLLEEIRVQRDLVSAERNELRVENAQVDSLALLGQVAALYQAHPVGAGKLILVDALTGFSLNTDAVLLKRILGNLIKNALEEIGPRMAVHVGGHAEQGLAVFTVSNPGVMPESVQRQVFKRSFSTKGAGRGLGTYSVKLLTERYLGGTVSFVSTKETGTVFTVRIPL